MQRLSDALPFGRQDVVPQPISDRILWTSVYGDTRPVPEPGPDTSSAERERSDEAMAVYRRGGNVRAYLAGHPEDEDAGK